MHKKMVILTVILVASCGNMTSGAGDTHPTNWGENMKWFRPEMVQPVIFLLFVFIFYSFKHWGKTWNGLTSNGVTCDFPFLYMYF